MSKIVEKVTVVPTADIMAKDMEWTPAGADRGRDMEGKGRYQLRKAAGLYWLLDMDQSGAERREPILFNESGAYIWEKYGQLQSKTAVAEELSREFGISVQEGLADIRQFFQQLKEQGMEL